MARTEDLIPHSLLLVAEDFGGGLSAAAVARAVARGLGSVDPEREIGCWLPEEAGAGVTADGWRTMGERAARSRAVVLAGPRLAAEAMPRDALFELATLARQGGIPAYGVSAARAPDLFEARILDLQVVVRADSAGGLVKAGAVLAAAIGGL